MRQKIREKITIINIITNVLSQLIIILCGLFIPKIILIYFGSEVNGLISSITQLLSYISLIEGGVTGVITASLYKPLTENDNKKISSILKTSGNFYKKIGLIFVVYSLILSLVYPLITNSTFSYLYISSLVMILSIGLLIQYMFALSPRILLIADKKGYIVSIAQIIVSIINLIAVIMCIFIYPNIHLLKLISGALFIIQPIIYEYYIKKYYIIDKNSFIDKKLLKNRWNGFAINIAYFIHVSTDVTILTLFTNLKVVSVYSIYVLVVNGVKAIITSISTAINPTIGHALALNDSLILKKKFEQYEYLFFNIIFVSFSITFLMITPFVLFYTNGIIDANYNQPLFGGLLLLSEGLYLIKTPHLNLAYSDNKFKELVIPCYAEAVINILLSLLLVNFFGLIGVTIGTIIAMFYRMIFQINFTKTIIKSYSIKTFYYKLTVFSISLFFIMIFIYRFLPILKYDFISICKYGLIYLIMILIYYLIINKLFFNKDLNGLLCNLFKKNK